MACLKQIEAANPSLVNPTVDTSKNISPVWSTATGGQGWTNIDRPKWIVDGTTQTNRTCNLGSVPDNCRCVLYPDTLKNANFMPGYNSGGIKPFPVNPEGGKTAEEICQERCGGPSKCASSAVSTGPSDNPCPEGGYQIHAGSSIGSDGDGSASSSTCTCWSTEQSALTGECSPWNNLASGDLKRQVIEGFLNHPSVKSVESQKQQCGNIPQIVAAKQKADDMHQIMKAVIGIVIMVFIAFFLGWAYLKYRRYHIGPGK